jgi:SOS response regulatory protein OraA/RecX
VSGRITALRRQRPGSVAVEVDGRRWRVVPDDVVVRCGLAAGVQLERPLLRELRRELRRAEALAAATGVLSRRDVSRRRLDERLRARGATASESERAVATLESAGLVDDARLARRRAEILAERGWGDGAISARLQAEGVAAELVRAAVAELSPEGERAAALARQAPDRRRAWKLLARRGFSADAAEFALGPLDEEPSAGLG